MSMVDDVLTEKDQLFAVAVGEILPRVTTTIYCRHRRVRWPKGKREVPFQRSLAR